MFETIIVTGIIAVVAGLAMRSFYRTMTGKNDGCGCTGGCQGCTQHNMTKRDRSS